MVGRWHNTRNDVTFDVKSALFSRLKLHSVDIQAACTQLVDILNCGYLLRNDC